MKLYFEKRVVVGFIVALAIIVSLGVHSFLTNQKFVETSKWVSHTNEVLFHSGQILAAVMKTGQCGYRLFIDRNNTLFSWLGYNKTKTVGKLTLGDIVTSDSVRIFQENSIVKKQGFSKNLEFYFVRNDGTIFPVILDSAAKISIQWHRVSFSADDLMMRPVWSNLISSALKFTGKVSGVAFHRQYAHKLFGVFQRLHTVYDYDKTGVDLAIAHPIIARHEGARWKNAKLKRRCHFYFFYTNQKQSDNKIYA